MEINTSVSVLRNAKLGQILFKGRYYIRAECGDFRLLARAKTLKQAQKRALELEKVLADIMLFQYKAARNMLENKTPLERRWRFRYKYVAAKKGARKIYQRHPYSILSVMKDSFRAGRSFCGKIRRSS